MGYRSNVVMCIRVDEDEVEIVFNQRVTGEIICSE